MKIAVLVISTNNSPEQYLKLRSSIYEYFFPDNEKCIFLFGDINGKNEDIVIPIQHLPWPLITLLRFEFFSRVNFSKFDFIFYFDVDTLVVDEIKDESLLKNNILAVEHPLKRKWENHFETNPISKSYVASDIDTPYYQACFFGGPYSHMIKMFNVLADNVRSDLNINYIAKWHDESHFNWYLYHNPPKPLDVSYAFPDPNRWKNYMKHIKPKIIHYNKASL